LDLDALPPPSYRVPLLVSLPSAADDGITASLVAAQDWVHGRLGAHAKDACGSMYVACMVTNSGVASAVPQAAVYKRSAVQCMCAFAGTLGAAGS
jgi:hypothetical protein